MESDCRELCRLCRKPTGEDRWAIFQPANELHLVSVLQMIRSCTSAEINESDQLPRYVCGGCYEELHFAYSTWQYYREAQNHPKCPAGEEISHYQCRICTRDDCEDLISVDCPSLNSDEPVAEIFRKFTGFTIREGDGLAPYFCDSCLAQLERAAKFRQHCQLVQDNFVQEAVHPWETMEFKVEEVGMLVDEPQAMLVPDAADPRVAKCSVCQHQKPPGEFWSACEGCLLEFSNADEWENDVEERAEPPRPSSPPVVDDGDGGAGSDFDVLIEELYDEEYIEEEDEEYVEEENEEQPVKKSVRLASKNTKPNTSLKEENGEDETEDEDDQPVEEKVLNKSTKRSASPKPEYNEDDDDEEYEQPAKKKPKEYKKSRLPNRDITKFLERRSMAFSDAFETLEDFPLYSKVKRKIPMCCACNSFYITEKAFASHIDSSHKKPEKPEPYMCEVCNTNFKNRKLLMYHRNKFELGIYGHCKVCDRILISKEDTDTHVMLCHTKEWEAFEAGRSRGLESPNSNSHETASDEEEVSYEYETLDSLTVVPKKGLQAFLKTVSMDIGEIFQTIPAGSNESYSRLCSRQNFCCGCKQFFITKQALKDHSLATHSATPTSNSSAQCQVCYKSFASPDQLAEHSKADPFFYCKACDRIFLLDSDFYSHRLASHVTDEEKESLKELYKQVIVRSAVKTASGKMIPPVYLFRCKIDGCSFKTIDENGALKHCLMHRQQQMESVKDEDQEREETQQVEVAESGIFDAMQLLNRKTRKDFVMKGGTFEGLDSLTVIPWVRFEAFLQKTSLRMEDLFDVLADNQHSVRIRRKTPLCCICNILFYTEQALQEHKAKEHPLPAEMTPLTCLQCNTTLKTKKHYQFHVTWKSIENCLYNYCRLCDQVLTHGRHTGHMYRKHMTKENRDRFHKLFTSAAIHGCAGGADAACTDCGEADDFKCIKCGGFFECAEDLSRHKTRKKWFKYSCQIGDCSYQAYSEDDVIEHCLMVSHVDASSNFSSHVPKRELCQNFDVMPTGGEDLPYCKLQLKGLVCCGCNKFFSTKSSLTKHCKAAHRMASGDGKWSCDVCRKTFGTAENKLRHDAKRNITSFDYCHSCQLVLGSGSFYRHQTAEHPGVNAPTFIERQFCEASEIRFKCCVPQCGNQFDTDTNLLQHMNAFHEPQETQDDQDTTFKYCKYCETKFKTVEKYCEHSNRQLELIRFCCLTTGCDFTTRSREDMLRHVSEESYGAAATGTTFKPVGTMIGDVPSQMIRDGTMHGIIDIFKQPGEVCCGCQAFLVSKEELQRHTAQFHATYSDDFQFRCSTCNKGFLYRCILENHQKNVPTRRRYQCRVCKITLLDMGQVDHHMFHVHGDSDEPRPLGLLYEKIEHELLPCCGCELLFPTLEDLVEHCLEIHPEPPPASKRQPIEECERCHKQFFNEEAYLSHVVGFANRLIYRCKIRKCSKQTTSIQEIEHHVSAISHAPKKQEKPSEFPCCVKSCQFRSESYESVIEHSVTEHAQERQTNQRKFSRDNYSCPVCCLRFADEIRMLNHRHGSGAKQCSICRNTYPPAKLAAHEVRCREKFKISCETCRIEFDRKLDYITHMRAEHGWKRTDKKKKEPKEVCNVCGALVSMYNMKNHLAAHEDLREFGCPLCPLRFNTSQIQKKHIKSVHIGDEMFPCRLGCANKNYKNNVDRNRHEKLVHTGDLPFKCDFCAKAFVRDRDLRLHMTQHTGRKMYSCERCPLEFDKKKDLTAHEAHCDATVADIDFYSDGEFEED